MNRNIMNTKYKQLTYINPLISTHFKLIKSKHNNNNNNSIDLYNNNNNSFHKNIKRTTSKTTTLTPNSSSISISVSRNTNKKMHSTSYTNTNKPSSKASEKTSSLISKAYSMNDSPKFTATNINSSSSSTLHHPSHYEYPKYSNSFSSLKVYTLNPKSSTTTTTTSTVKPKSLSSHKHKHKYDHFNLLYQKGLHHYKQIQSNHLKHVKQLLHDNNSNNKRNYNYKRNNCSSYSYYDKQTKWKANVDNKTSNNVIKKYQDEMEECTFRPKIQALNIKDDTKIINANIQQINDYCVNRRTLIAKQNRIKNKMKNCYHHKLQDFRGLIITKPKEFVFKSSQRSKERKNKKEERDVHGMINGNRTTFGINDFFLINN